MSLPDIQVMPLVLLGCLAVGFVIRNTNILKDKYNQWIPFIVAILGIIFAVWIEKNVNPETVIYGMISGLASTGLHQAFRSFLNIESKEDKNGGSNNES